MKTGILLTTGLVVSIVLGGLVSAQCHPGRTDSKGGHYNSKTGEYHYHGGSSSSSDSTSRSINDPVSYGNFIGTSAGKPEKPAPPKQVVPPRPLPPKTPEELSLMANRVVQFRLQQATNGSYLYQCKVATNYLNGTDGFPKNKVLAEYWLNQALINTNK